MNVENIEWHFNAMYNTNYLYFYMFFVNKDLPMNKE